MRMRSRQRRIQLFDPLYAIALVLILLLAACSKGPESTVVSSATPEAPEPLLPKVRAARENLLKFYLKTFAGMIKSGNYNRELPIVRLDHYAHRLWVPERDPTYDEAVKTLAAMVEFREADIHDGSTGTTTTLHVAFFGDNHQLHRDQYAMIMSETKLDQIGAASLADFVRGAKLDYGAGVLTRRIDQPWSAILMSTNSSAGESWMTARGRRISADDVLRDTVAAPFFPDDRYKFACYDYHTVYALAAAVGAGYPAYKEVARARLKDAFARADRVCADSIKQGDGMEEIVGRIKLNGHLVEAFFRGWGTVYTLDEFRPDVTRAVQGLLDDSEKISDLAVYQGPPDIFIAVPHAIHGLGMANSLLGASTAPMPRSN